MYNGVRILRERSGEPLWSRSLRGGEGAVVDVPQGHTLRMTDRSGGRAVDAILYEAADVANHYSAGATMSAAGRAVLGGGMAIRSVRGDALATIAADSFARHDPWIGHCSSANFSLNGGDAGRRSHNCHDTMLLAIAREGRGRIGKPDIVTNVNFFLGIPFNEDGTLGFPQDEPGTDSLLADAMSTAGDYVELRAERDIVILMSNCPGMADPNVEARGIIDLTLWAD